ncbi:MAG TPA: ABC transporter permease [Longimicrobium sp.]|jgi:ABC-type transport system involved in multi-copper enzyme maturation permease subunit
MKLRTIFRFELAYQARRVSTWLVFTILAVIAFIFTRESFLSDALYAEFFLNSPFIIASATVFGSLLWLVLGAATAGEIAARDVETGMHPLTYTAPVSKAEHLGGRFLAALVLNLLILLAIPLGVLLAVYASGADPELIGPFRPAAYLTAFGFFALPNAFVGTSVQFAWAALGRRALGSYVGSVLLIFVAYGGFAAVMYYLERQDVAALLDVFGHLYMTSEVVLGWSPIEKSTRLIALEGPLLHGRLVWAGVALAALAFTYARFRFEHLAASAWWTRMVRFGRRRGDAHAPTPSGSEIASTAPIAVPHIQQAFGFASRARQTLAIAWDSFRTIAKSRGGLIVLAGIAVIAVIVLPQNFESSGTPLLPRTEYVLTYLTVSLTQPFTQWVITPLFIVLYAGELVWREREAGLGEITDAAPVPDGVRFLGKFLGLSLILAVWMALLMAVGMAVQVRMGYYKFEIGLYLKVLFGLQLPEYLLFAVLALVVQGMVNQKYIGHLLALLAYFFIAFAAWLGIDHDLLVYGSAPRWTYSDMRGFGASLGPWTWFMLYWAAWALLLAVVARVLWMRGLEGSIRVRLQLARLRFTRPTAVAAAMAAGLVLALGGFVFYNTNVLNEYASPFERAERQAEYERRFGRYANVPQPRMAGTKLHLEIHPRRREVEVRGSHLLVNRTRAPIATIHLATSPGAQTGAITFDRPATRVVEDQELGHAIYALKQPLRPGESLRLGFAMHLKPRGFRNSGASRSVTAASSFFTSEFLPKIGYDPRRELFKPSERRAHGLSPRRLFPSLAEVEAGGDVTGGAGDFTGAAPIAVETVIGTDGDQTAVAPGLLRRTWTKGGRRYFHYATDAPIGNEYRFFSARYAVHEERWTPKSGAGRPVAIQVFHHPRHAANLPRMLRSVRASLEHNSREFGPYPHSFIRLVENPGSGMGAHADATTIDYTEGFSRYNPAEDPNGLDMPFAIIAHEMAHQWGVAYALAEGAPLLSESFAWYAAMGVVEETYGRAHLERLRRFFRQPSPIPPIRQSVPLLRAMDPYAAYRKGPAAFFALREYMGADRVNLAFRRLREKQRAGAPPATTLDLYRELQAVTADSLHPLLHDLLAANTFWQLKTERASVKQIAGGAWEVTLRLRARKVTIDPAGVETEVPMNEWVPIGVFAPSSGQGTEYGERLYLRPHRIRTGPQTITLTVPRKPAEAGIDPYLLLIDLERFDNVEAVEGEG